MLQNTLLSPQHSRLFSYVFDDGGRAAAGYTGQTRDCSCRAVAIATGLPYRKVYNDLSKLARNGNIVESRRYRPSVRNGVDKGVIEAYLTDLGWAWVPTMRFGDGCKVHLRPGELPSGRLIVSVSKHLVAVIDGVIHDTYDCSRGGTRCVYGYYSRVKHNPDS
jgi:hypothetical protein